MVRGSPRTSASSSAFATSKPTRKAMRKGTHSCTECEYSLLHPTAPARQLMRICLGRRRKIRCDWMPGATVCFNCKSRRTQCVSQTGHGPRLQLRGPPESESLLRISEAPAEAARDSDLPQTPHVLENSVTDQRAPFLAVLDPSGVSRAST